MRVIENKIKTKDLVTELYNVLVDNWNEIKGNTSIDKKESDNGNKGNRWPTL